MKMNKEYTNCNCIVDACVKYEAQCTYVICSFLYQGVNSEHDPKARSLVNRTVNYLLKMNMAAKNAGRQEQSEF